MACLNWKGECFWGSLPHWKLSLFLFLKMDTCTVHTVNSSLGEAVWSYCFNIVALSTAPCRWESRDYKVHFPTFLILNWKVGISQSRGTRSTTKQQRHEHYRGQSPNVLVVHISLIQILLCNFFSLFNFSTVGLAMASSSMSGGLFRQGCSSHDQIFIWICS